MFEAVAIGVSAGGLRALRSVLGPLPESFRLPIAIVQHIEANSDDYLAEYLGSLSSIRVKEAEDKEAMEGGTAYLAPAGYHLLVEPDRTFSLSVDDKVNYCRPSIDLLFESAADAFGATLVGIVLTGANGDGSKGLRHIKGRGGYAIVQDPATAEAPYMPRTAAAGVAADRIVPLEEIPKLLVQLAQVTRQ
ncbi:MAG: chemotaxis protein CheB [Alphaproteobacteria bacterium]|nr:chemotaxis protein CheB [Alphaproteobacteria bacterium]